MVPTDKKVNNTFSSSLDNRFKQETSTCMNNKVYVGNANNLIIVIGLWFAYITLSVYFLVLISPHLWIEYSPAISIIGIFISIPGLYNAIKCYFTDPGVLKKNTHVIEQKNDEEKQQNVGIIQQVNQENPIQINYNIDQNNQIQSDNKNNENQLGTQKIQISEKSDTQHQQQQEQTNEEIKKEKNQLEEPINKTQKQQPQFNVELVEIQNQDIKDQVTNDWVVQMQNGLNQIQNGFKNCDQQLIQLNQGLQNFENQQNVFFNPFPQKQPASLEHKYEGGNLYEQRYCTTCKLIRPPLASHCNECNQCVKNFDHHCFFMGNCIGQRNHKNFYLFLWCTYVWVLYALAFSIVSFVDNIKNNSFVFVQFYNNSVLFYLFVSILGLLLILACLKLNKEFTKYMIYPSLGITLISFIWIASYQDVKYYENPVIPLLGMILYLSSALALSNFAFFDCFLACVGSTLKQQNFKNKNKMEQEKFTLSNGCKTYYEFITFTPPKSDILNE